MSRTVSSQPMAEGRTAEIYAWDDRHILKLYREWCPRDWVDYEAGIARAVYEAGVPSPEASEIVEVGGRRGLLYERLEGISMLRDLNARPWNLFKHARSLAELQMKIHQISIPGLPSYQDRLRYDVGRAQQLTDHLRARAVALLHSLPDGVTLCHGDYHPGNVFLTKDGPVVIDWMTACSGSPWADVARSSLILSVGAKGAGKQVHPIIRTLIMLYHRTYLKRYRELRPDPNHEVERWLPVIAAGRLDENIVPEREALLKIVKDGLAK